MNLHSLRFGVVIIAAFGLVACSTSPLSRIDSNRARYESWPIEVQEAVMNGEAKKGMMPEQVQMALGKPTQVISRSANGGEDEVWVYRKGGSGSSLLNSTGLSIGGGMGGVNVGGGMGGGRRPSNADEQEVVFGNGVVVRADPKL